MNALLKQLKALFQQYFPLANAQTPQSRKLLFVTMQNLGRDLSPKENEYGCAETVNTLAMMAWLDPIGGDLSTLRMYEALQSRSQFVEVFFPLPGDIIISPTSKGNGRMSNGHVGVVVDNGLIASNNSMNSLLEINYTLRAWKERYGVVGGFPVLFYRRII